MSHERTLVIIKPDAFNRSLVGRIITKFEEKGLKLVALRMKFLPQEKLEDHYGHHKEKPFFAGLVKYMSSAPAVLVVLEGKEAVSVVRTMCGPTNSRTAPPGTVRGDFGMSGGQNIVHSSENAQEAQKEIMRFFREDEILSYDKADLNQIYAEDEI